MSLPIVLRALRAVVGNWVGPGLLSIPLLLLLHRRLGEICGRMERLAARFEAGKLRQTGPRTRQEAGAREAVADGTRAAAARIWPMRFGWLLRIGSHRAAVYGSQLRVILEQPEMVALLTAAPQAARLLRPLCRMLAVETSLLRPRREGDPEPADLAAAPVEKKIRVRKKRPPFDWGRIPLPRGVLTAARRQGFGKLPKELR